MVDNDFDALRLVFSAEVASVLKDHEVLNVALDAWQNPAQGLDGWEAAAKAVVRTAQAQGPDRDSLACMAVQCWWQEKPLQRLLTKRAELLDEFNVVGLSSIFKILV